MRSKVLSLTSLNAGVLLLHAGQAATATFEETICVLSITSAVKEAATSFLGIVILRVLGLKIDTVSLIST